MAIRAWRRPDDVRITHCDVKIGTGQVVTSGAAIALHYAIADDATALDAGVYRESSFEGGAPLDVIAGSGELSPGLDDALSGVREGGTRRLSVHSTGGDAPMILVDVFVVSVTAQGSVAEAWASWSSMRRDVD